MAKILVIDDDSATRLLLKRDLKLEGHDVTLAKDGEEGLQLAIELHPALIICDWIMPNLDGVEVCRLVKSKPELATTFVILLTSKVELDDRVQGLDAGADDFLSKPVNPAELLARVRAGLRLHQSQLQLRQFNQQLSQTLQELQQTQAQLIQSEKMSSLGQLVGGIAHEINNPVTFIYGNLNHAGQYVEELIEFLRLFQQHYPNPVPEMQSASEELDLEFLMTDFPQLLHSMKRGAGRIREIVQSLRNFSHLDEAPIKSVNLHEGIESTLSILQPRLAGIEIIQDYGKLPEVECYPGDINQVFFHILNNAIDALESFPGNGEQETGNGERGTGNREQGTEQEERGEQKEKTINNQRSTINHQPPTPDRGQKTIRIRTETIGDGDSQRALIRISNNGHGISPDIISKIFNPFFTTKPIGSGKGLGLTICYQIVVERHGGELQCNSEPGKETEFAIAIPLRQAANKS